MDPFTKFKHPNDEVIALENTTLSPLYIKTIKYGLKMLRDEGILSDVNVKVGNKTIPCHRAILSMFSDYFRCMFESGMKESQEKNVTLEMLDPVVVDDVINYMYTDDITITVENVESVLSTAVYFQSESLINRCQQEILRLLTPDCLIPVWRLCETYSEWPLLNETCLNYALSHFVEIFKSIHFKELDVHKLSLIIASNDLEITEEDQVVQAVSRWIRFDQESRMPLLKDLLPHIRLPLVLDAMLQGFIMDFHNVTEEKPLKKYIEEAQEYKENRALQMKTSSVRTEYRKHCKKEKVLLVVSGAESSEDLDRQRSLWCYSFHRKCWEELQELPRCPGFGFATCTFGESNLFLSGGEGSTEMLKYNGLSGIWTECPDFEHGRAGHNMVAIRNFIYLVGGQGPDDDGEFLARRYTDEVERYNVEEETWTQFANLSIPVVDSVSATSGSKILIFSGYDDSGETTGHVQCVDTLTCSSYVLFYSQLIHNVSCLLQCNHDIFLTVEQNIMKLNKCKTGFDMLGTMTFRSGFAMEKNGSDFIVIGGETSGSERGVDILHNEASREVFQFKVDTPGFTVWESQLPEGRFECGCHFMVIYRPENPVLAKL